MMSEHRLFPSGDELRLQCLEFLLVDVHHRVVVGHQQHLLAALHQRLDECAHERRLGDAGGLALGLRDGVLDDRPPRGIVRGAQQLQLSMQTTFSL